MKHFFTNRVRMILLALITAALVGVDKYFRRFATN